MKVIIYTIMAILLTYHCSYSKVPPFDETIIVKTICNLNPDINNCDAQKITKSIIKHSKNYEIPWNLVVAIINTESEFNKNARSNGCYGLMQINLSAHWKTMIDMKINQKTLFHIDNNINLGCKILKEYINNSKSINVALKKYSGGNHRYVKKVNNNMSKIKSLLTKK